MEQQSLQTKRDLSFLVQHQNQTSLELMPSRITYDVYDGSTSSTIDFGINEPCHMLLKYGNTSNELQAVEIHLRSELQSHNPRYEDLQQAVTHALGLQWWRGSGYLINYYSPFIIIWHPEAIMFDTEV